MKCEVCGIEYGSAECPQCCKDQGMIHDFLRSPDGIAESQSVIDLKWERCHQCLKYFVCGVIAKAKKAERGQIVGSLFLAKRYNGKFWRIMIDCRGFVCLPLAPRTKKIPKSDEYVGDLFREA